MKSIVLSMALAAFCFIFNCPTRAYSQANPAEKPAEKPPVAGAAIPDEFLPLYKALDALLDVHAPKYPYKKGDGGPLVAPNLAMAASYYSPSLSDAQRWKDLLSVLDIYKAMNIDAVMVQITAPDLALGDKENLIDFYRQLAKEVHAREMKLMVEHFISIPFEPNRAHPLKGVSSRVDLPDDQEGKRKFLEIKEQEVALIYQEIQPDYLSILTEPEAAIVQLLHLSFSADELATWVGEVTARLKNSGASPRTLLGAGAGTWEPEDFVLKFAQQPNLDYIDIHLYILKIKGEDQIEKLATLVHKVREARPEIKIVLGETWLMKHGKEGPKPASMLEVLARNNFSFWGPLDEKYLTLAMGIAQKENISVVSPFFSQHFFLYYRFGDAEYDQLPPWPKSIPTIWNKAFGQIHDKKLSTTGKAMKALLDPREK